MAIQNIPIGMKFGRLEVIGIGEPQIRKNGWKSSTSIVRCDCGAEKTIENSKLKTGNTRSCGCLNNDKRAERGRSRSTHRMTNSPEYHSWKGLKARCENQKELNYENYGGRGITVCERWKESFENFLEDMGYRPSHKHSIDRIDNNGGYCKENCRWATPIDQANNRRGNRRVTFYEKTMTIAQWSRISQICEIIILKRLDNGWTEKEAVWMQVLPRRKTRKGVKLYPQRRLAASE